MRTQRQGHRDTKRLGSRDHKEMEDMGTQDHKERGDTVSGVKRKTSHK